MAAPVITPAFAHKLPAAEPTCLQLALSALRAHKAMRDHLSIMDAEDDVAGARQDRLDAVQFDAAAAFFTALERETGIDRALFSDLGEIA